MSRVIRFDQFLPVEQGKFLSALTSAGVEAAQFDVSKMEISPPLMPGNVIALVTVKLWASGIANSYEDAVGSSWVGAFAADLAAGLFSGLEPGRADDSAADPDLLARGQA